MTFLLAAEDHAATANEVVEATSGFIGMAWLIPVVPLLGFLLVLALTKTLRESTATLERARALLSDRSPLYVETQRMLQEVANAARSMRLLTDYLERHPEALLQGKGRGR